MIQLDKEDKILKILNINANQVGPDKIKYGLWNRLAGYEEYKDKNSLHEHLYSQEITDKIHASIWIEMEEELKAILQEIEALCNKERAAYWRIIDIPWK